jgi:hypothetical protein
MGAFIGGCLTPYRIWIQEFDFLPSPMDNSMKSGFQVLIFPAFSHRSGQFTPEIRQFAP